MRISPILKSLALGQTATFTLTQYTSILSTATRLKRAGIGLYASKIVGDSVQLTRLEGPKPAGPKDTKHKLRSKLRNALEDLAWKAEQFDKNVDTCDIVIIVKGVDLTSRLTIPIGADFPDVCRVLEGLLSMQIRNL